MTNSFGEWTTRIIRHEKTGFTEIVRERAAL